MSYVNVSNSIPLQPRALSVSVTDWCNASCSMCVSASGPSRLGQDAAPETVRAVLRETARIESLGAVMFVGGEPFGRYRLLRDFVECAASHVDSVGVVTNCYWAITYQVALRKVRELASAGLTRLTVSADFYHSEYVPFGYVDNAIRAAHDAGLHCNLNCVTRFGTDDLDAVCSSLASYDLLDHANSFPCVAANGTGGSVRLLELDALRTRCQLVISTLVMSTDGSVYACCGPGTFTSPLRIGNIVEQSLCEIVTDATDDTLVLLLAIYGPSFLVDLHPKLAYLRKLRYTGRCHLCKRVLGDARNLAAIQTRLAAYHDAIHEIYDTLASRTWR